jgi:cytochrome c-type biogenesis protein CcmF
MVVPAIAAAVAALALALYIDAAGSPWALLLFAFAAFALVALAQEFGRAASARRALTGEGRATALARAVARNRHRYGGYTAHAGIAVMLIAVAASSSFQTKRDLRLNVGETGTVADYTLTYERLSSDPATERIAFTALLKVERDGEPYATLAPARNYYPTMDPAAGPIGRYFDGEATSEVGLRSEGGEDLWTAFQPDLTTLTPDIERGNRQLADVGPDAQGLAIIALAEAYAADPPPANFRVIVNPGAAWLWVGGLIALGGALFAVWPTAGSRRRAEAAYAARLGRELSRG